MNDNDLIRRGDALQCCTDQLHNTALLTSLPPQSSAAWDARNAIAALPAAPTFTAADVERDGADSFDRLVQDGIDEAMKAMRKFPQPNYVISKIAEEAGEVVKAAIHCAEGRETTENLRGEMKQLIAMLYRLWIEGDRVHGLGSVSADLAQRVKE